MFVPVYVCLMFICVYLRKSFIYNFPTLVFKGNILLMQHASKDVQAFTIPLKPISYNQLLRKHYRVVGALANEWKEATMYALKAARVVPFDALAYPLRVECAASWKQNRTHDIDSLYIKPVLDQLKRSGIIPDDSIRFVASVTCTGATKQKTDSLTVRLLPFNYPL